MNKELTKEEAEEFYNKLWLENKELIQDNMNKLSMERFELELELVDKNKEIERLNNIIKEFDKLIENEINESKLEDDYERVDSLEYCLATLKELKGSDKE